MAARLPTSSLPNTLRRCVDTVHELISKTLAIALLVYPLATIRAISRSRGLRRRDASPAVWARDSPLVVDTTQRVEPIVISMMTPLSSCPQDSRVTSSTSRVIAAITSGATSAGASPTTCDRFHALGSGAVTRSPPVIWQLQCVNNLGCDDFLRLVRTYDPCRHAAGAPASQRVQVHPPSWLARLLSHYVQHRGATLLAGVAAPVPLLVGQAGGYVALVQGAGPQLRPSMDCSEAGVSPEVA